LSLVAVAHCVPIFFRPPSRGDLARAYHCLLIEIDDEPPDPAIRTADVS
jgi:hypothetical protein